MNDEERKVFAREATIEIKTAADSVVDAYTKLVAASDGLARAMAYREDYVLGRVMPKRACDRRNSIERIRLFLEQQIQHAVGCRISFEAMTRIKAERLALIRKLKLTKANLKTLGVNMEGTEDE